MVPVVENVRLAERTYRLRIADSEIGRLILPGQFVMLRIPGNTDPLLGRPFALYDTYLNEVGDAAGYDLVYLVVGKMTNAMSRLVPGDSVEVWGPLGNGFTLTATPHLLMVAGGIGQTPFPAVARAYLGLRHYGLATGQQGSGVRSQPPLAEFVSLCYGVRSAAYLAGLDDFRSLGVPVAIATDDGSAGHHGFVTDLVPLALKGDSPPTLLMGCGPEPMMHKLAEVAAAAGVPCELSLETPMACGIGACFSCVARIRPDTGPWDYRRVCIDGPVFEASRVVFH
ncbi:MAG: dihydroorotate dehydrogenase electron transfer subunit [Planctomycetes bacterium]|nr:dihydroorotate dehydrogenase electron transfer subunit [Planctomycetota bacterium]